MVRMFMAEKGIELPKVEVDLVKGENRQEEHLKRNPAGQCPALELDDGRYIAEITAICEYLEEKHPNPPLIGRTPEERAETRMWTRRLDLNLCEPMANGFRFGKSRKFFENRIRVIPEAAEGLIATARDWVKKLDGWLAGKQFICGDRFTMADILVFTWIDFFSDKGQPLDPELKNVAAWHARIAARPSAKA
jgi:glutathione S-transferase